MADILTVIRKVRPLAVLPPDNPLVDVWLSWWRGRVDKFHNYRIFNGQTYLDCERKSLGMAKKICEDWAGALLNEKCGITIPEANGANEKLQHILGLTNFREKANGGIEKAFALGMGAFVENVTDIEVGDQGTVRANDKSRIRIDFINRKRMRPIVIEDRNVTECAFESKNSIGTAYVVHVKDGGTYKIHNFQYNEKDEIVKYYVFDTRSSVPWFQVVRPNIESNALNEYSDNEIGVSVFGNSIDTLKSIDNLYDGMDLEYVLARRRIFVQQDVASIDYTTGKPIMQFDPYEAAFYTTPKDKNGEAKIQNEASEIRHASFIEGMNAQLSYLSSKCGMGENYYRYDAKTGQATATQIVSEQSSFFKSIKKHEIVLENALRNMVRAIIDASNLFTNDGIGNVDDKDIVVFFDDSIIEDKDAMMRRDKEDVNAGVMSKVEYRVKWYGEDEKTAMEKVGNDPQSWVELANLGFVAPYKAVAKKLNISDEEAKKLYDEEQARRMEASKLAAQAFEPSPEDEKPEEKEPKPSDEE